MALTPNFSTSQTYGSPQNVTFTDTSTGSDGTITQRRIYVLTYNGTYLVEDGTTTDYEVWDDFPSTTTITLDLLDKDYGVLVTVQWLTSGGVVTYTKSSYIGFSLYNETFDYQLTQLLSANPMLISDDGYWQHKSDLRTFIDSGDQAISLASDTTNAQSCYDDATNLRLNSVYYFNENPA